MRVSACECVSVRVCGCAGVRVCGCAGVWSAPNRHGRNAELYGAKPSWVWVWEVGLDG